MILRAERAALVLQHEVTLPEQGRRGSLLRLTFGETVATEPMPMGPALPGVLNYILGDDPDAWVGDVRSYSGVDFGQIAHDVGLQVLSSEGAVTLRLSLGSAADLEALQLRVEGAQKMRVSDTAHPATELSTSIGSIRLLPPRVRSGGSATAGGLDRVHYRQRQGQVIGLERNSGSGHEAVVVDLEVQWSTYLGGDLGRDYVYSLDVDAQGRTIMGGETEAMDFPTTPGAFDTSWNGGFFTSPSDAYVSCLETDGSTLAFSTFLGGASDESVQAIAVHPSGDIILGGRTASLNFPTTPGVVKASTTAGNGFITRLTPDGASLVFSTYLGGSTGDLLYDLCLMPDGSIAACGHTISADFPVTANAFDRTFAGGPVTPDAFVTVVDSLGQDILYSTYLGSTEDDRAFSVASLAEGRIALTGPTFSLDFPVTPGASDIVHSGVGKSEGFVFLLDTISGQPTYSTFVGPCSPERIKVQPDGRVTIAGHTSSAFMPVTKGSWDETYNGGGADGFVLRLNADGTDIDYATYIGGSSEDWLRDLAIDSAGRPTIVGGAASDDYPTTEGALITSAPGPGGYTGFITRLDPTGSNLQYSTFWGGFIFPVGVAVQLDAALDVTIGGSSGGLLTVTDGAYDTGEPVIFLDAFVSRLSLQPTGASTFGASTPGASGPLAIGVTEMPAIGASSFAMTCTSAPPSSSQGLLALSLFPRDDAFPVKGFDLWLEPSRIALLIPAVSSAEGYSAVPLPIPNRGVFVGVSTYWQFAWMPPGGSGAWWASNALKLTFQP